ncbi:MAG: hypothetical protein P4M00_24935 [Azospirillaceae bacterium]|nr:hypothetical protein [Azospirillaceae bacterium]
MTTPTPAPAPIPAPAAVAEPDDGAKTLAARLPLDPATLNLHDRLPADVPAAIHRLGLRVPAGRPTDMRGRTPTEREISDALVH